MDLHGMAVKHRRMHELPYMDWRNKPDIRDIQDS